MGGLRCYPCLDSPCPSKPNHALPVRAMPCFNPYLNPNSFLNICQAKNSLMNTFCEKEEPSSQEGLLTTFVLLVGARRTALDFVI